MACTFFDSEEALDAVSSEWDALAVAAGRPYCSPAWMRAWWRAASPSGARLCVGVVRDGARVMGIAPLFTSPRGAESEARLLCAGMSTRLDLLALDDEHERVSQAFAEALASLRPRLRALVFEGVERSSPWPRLIAASWPARLRPRVKTALELPAPTVDLQHGFDAWLASRSRSFRRELLRVRRRWQELGAVIELSPPGRLDQDLEHLERLHRARWSSRGGSSNIDAGRRRMLAEAGRELLPTGRFRLFTVRVKGDVAAAELFVSAGGVVSAWGGGFDERWLSLSPSIVAVAAAVEDACARGERCLDLGEGAEPFKLRFGEAASPVVWTRLYPRTRRYPLTRAGVVPHELRHAIRRRLSPARRAQLKRLAARISPRRAKSPA